MDVYAEITPHDLAALSLCRAADSLEKTNSQPSTWFFVILDLHRALYCALIASLAGSAQIGVYSEKLQAEWLAYFESSRTDPDAEAPTGDYVLSFRELLSQAEVQNPLLQLTEERRTDILMLNDFRGNLEHVKPQSWCLEVGGLPRMSASAACAFEMLLQSFAHKLQAPSEIEAAISKVKEFGLKYPSKPPGAWLA
jgi:hypothetical protein